RATAQSAPSPVAQRLAALRPDDMTAREALAVLYELKDLSERG
ncbi:MAG: hypothetical protein RLZZ491_2064, partial [Pseudomonadota bacterium]